jgi:hypothetical protein
MKAGTRTKYIESLIYSDKVSEEEKRLLQNGFIPEKFKADFQIYSDNNDDIKGYGDIEPIIFGNYFYINPEKVSGKIVEGSGYINPVKVKGNIDDSIKALNTMKRNTNSGYKGFAKINQQAKKNIENMKAKPKFSKGDIVQDSKGKAKILRSLKPAANSTYSDSENYLYDVERENGAKTINMPESKFELISSASEQETMKAQMNMTGKMVDAMGGEPSHKINLSPEFVAQANADLENLGKVIDKAEADKKPYIAFYKGKQHELYAKSKLEAQQNAAAFFKAKHSYDVAVELANEDEVVANAFKEPESAKDFIKSHIIVGSIPKVKHKQENIPQFLTEDEFKKQLPEIDSPFVGENGVKYKPSYDKYSRTTRYFKNGRRVGQSVSITEAWKSYNLDSGKKISNSMGTESTCSTCDNPSTEPEITPATDLNNIDPQKETVSSNNVPSIIHNAEVILEDEPKSSQTYYTVEDSVKFLNPGISDDELKAWVWYKRLHGNPMKGWNKWYIDSDTDSKNTLVYAKEETEILGNNYKSIGYVPAGALLGLKTRFNNVYGEITFIVCKTQQGNLIWANKAHVEERNTVTAKNEGELDRLVKEGALVYTGIDYLPIPIFLFGNFYNKIQGIENNKETIITKFGEEMFNSTMSILDKFKPKPKSFGDPVPSKRPFISCLSEMANDPEIFGVLQLNEEINIRLGSFKRNRFYETTDKITLYEAFLSYLQQYVKDTDIKGTNKSNIKNYYFAKAIKWPKDEVTNEELFTESQKAELIGNARFEAERLFSEFLANGLTIEDRMKLDMEWNIRYNAISNVNNFVHKVPIGYEGSAMFKAGKLVIKPAQREGLAYLNITGSGCLAYEVGFGKTATAILNVAQLITQGKIKRPLVIVPKPTYKNWLKELFGYYSDGTKTELYEFEGSKYYYGILSGTKIKLNDWYNLKGKTLARLVKEYGSEEAINRLLPENTITVLTYQGFEQIGFSHDVSEKVFDSIYEAISQKGNIDADAREEAKEYQKMREIIGIAQKNTVVDIDKLGIDHITIDEAHNFKNSFSGCGKDPSTGRKLFGIQANRSNRAVKMFFHTQYVQRFYGKNIVMLTATPFTNSPLEWFSMISYVGLDSLLNYNLWNIQKFFEQFVMQTVEYTVDVKGELKVKPVIKSIQNLGLFQTILFNCFHRKDDPKEAGITRPCLYDMPNKDISTHLDMNEYQINNQQIVMDLVSSYSKDNKGVILRALAFSQNNAFSPFLSAHEQPEGALDFVEKSPKIHYICECIKSVKEYHESRGEECSGQVIYSNRGVEFFDLIKEYLQDYCGFKTDIDFDSETVDEVEILTGGGTEKDEDRKELVKEAFNAGLVKVIIGTSTIKEGVNLQERGTVIYNALPEYNPSDMQQLKGRIWRQGNMYGYVRFVVPLVVNSMDAFIWQKVEEKSARLGSIWTKVESNLVEMQSELSPEEIKYSLVESVSEKLKIKLNSEQNKAEYDLKLADENLQIFDAVNYEITQLKEYIGKAKTDILEKIPKWTLLLDIVAKKILPLIEASDHEDKAKVKKKFQDLKEKLNDLISQFMICRDLDWNNPKEILTLMRIIDQRTYELPSRYEVGLMAKVAPLIISENFDWRLFTVDGWTKRKITEHWSTIAKAERSIFQPYGKTWNDNTDELRDILKKRFDETTMYLAHINSEEYKDSLIAQIHREIEEAQLKRGSVKDRVEQFKTTNNLLSYLKDNTDLDNCPIPKDPCCEYNHIEVEETPDVYDENKTFEVESVRIDHEHAIKAEEKAVSEELRSEMSHQDKIDSLESRIELIQEMVQEAKGKKNKELHERIELLNEMMSDLKETPKKFKEINI